MRTAKRTLAIVLAALLAIGMFVMGSSAYNLPDEGDLLRNACDTFLANLPVPDGNWTAGEIAFLADLETDLLFVRENGAFDFDDIGDDDNGRWASLDAAFGVAEGALDDLMDAVGAREAATALLAKLNGLNAANLTPGELTALPGQISDLDTALTNYAGIGALTLPGDFTDLDTAYGIAFGWFEPIEIAAKSANAQLLIDVAAYLASPLGTYYTVNSVASWTVPEKSIIDGIISTLNGVYTTFSGYGDDDLTKDWTLLSGALITAQGAYSSTFLAAVSAREGVNATLLGLWATFMTDLDIDTEAEEWEDGEVAELDAIKDSPHILFYYNNFAVPGVTAADLTADWVGLQNAYDVVGPLLDQLLSDVAARKLADSVWAAVKLRAENIINFVTSDPDGIWDDIDDWREFHAMREQFIIDYTREREVTGGDAGWINIRDIYLDPAEAEIIRINNRAKARKNQELLDACAAFWGTRGSISTTGWDAPDIADLDQLFFDFNALYTSSTYGDTTVLDTIGDTRWADLEAALGTEVPRAGVKGDVLDCIDAAADGKERLARQALLDACWVYISATYPTSIYAGIDFTDWTTTPGGDVDILDGLFNGFVDIITPLGTTVARNDPNPIWATLDDMFNGAHPTGVKANINKHIDDVYTRIGAGNMEAVKQAILAFLSNAHGGVDYGFVQDFTGWSDDEVDGYWDIVNAFRDNHYFVMYPITASNAGVLFTELGNAKDAVETYKTGMKAKLAKDVNAATLLAYTAFKATQASTPKVDWTTGAGSETAAFDQVYDDLAIIFGGADYSDPALVPLGAHWDTLAQAIENAKLDRDAKIRLAEERKNQDVITACENYLDKLDTWPKDEWTSGTPTSEVEKLAAVRGTLADALALCNDKTNLTAGWAALKAALATATSQGDGIIAAADGRIEALNAALLLACANFLATTRGAAATFDINTTGWFTSELTALGAAFYDFENDWYNDFVGKAADLSLAWRGTGSLAEALGLAQQLVATIISTSEGKLALVAQYEALIEEIKEYLGDLADLIDTPDPWTTGTGSETERMEDVITALAGALALCDDERDLGADWAALTQALADAKEDADEIWGDVMVRLGILSDRENLIAACRTYLSEQRGILAGSTTSAWTSAEKAGLEAILAGFEATVPANATVIGVSWTALEAAFNTLKNTTVPNYKAGIQARIAEDIRWNDAYTAYLNLLIEINGTNTSSWTQGDVDKLAAIKSSLESGAASLITAKNTASLNTLVGNKKAELTNLKNNLDTTRYIFGTKYVSNFWNWIMFIVLFGWIWMWFL